MVPFMGNSVKHSYRMKNKQVRLYSVCADFEAHERAPRSSRSSANKFVNLCSDVHELPRDFSRHLLQACELEYITLNFY